MEATGADGSRTVKGSESEYVRKDKRTVYLLDQHRKIVADGYKPSAVAVNDPDNDDPLIHEACDVCDYDDLLGVIEWTNPITGNVVHTGFTCFGRVAEKLEGISEKDHRTLRWVSQNRSSFDHRKYFIVEAERVRLISYKRPLTDVYQSDWSRAVSDVYPRRAELGLTTLETGVVETLHNRSGRYWTGHPTPRQRKILNGVVRAYLRIGFNPSE